MGEEIARGARFPAEEFAEQGVDAGEAALLRGLVEPQQEAHHELLRAALPDLAALTLHERALLGEWLDRVVGS